MTEQGEQSALTLAEAAQALGITEAAVRMRWKRGKLQGFKQDGRIRVYVTESAPPAPAQRPEQPGEPVKSQTEQATEQTEQVTDRETATIIELQRTELTRLLRDNERLHSEVERQNTRLDTLLETHAQERDREQVLRQQLQNQVDRLTAQLALPAPEMDPQTENSRLARLAETERALSKAQADVEHAVQETSALKGGVMALLRWLEKRT
jgi:plasmid maintenance system antidote protein VapI